MIYKNSYKVLNKIKYFTYLTHYSRLLNFKRPKWKYKQKSLRKLLSKLSRLLRYKKKKKYSKHLFNAKRMFCVTETVIKARPLRYKYIKKEKRFISNSLNYSFGNLIPIFFFKKILRKSISRKISFAVELLVKPFYRLEVLVWRLGFYKTIRHTRVNVSLKNVLVNQKIIRHNYILRLDDIVEIQSSLTAKSHGSFAPTFLWEVVEVDYYLKKLVVISDFNHFDGNLLYFLYHERFDFDSFLNYIVSN